MKNFFSSFILHPSSFKWPLALWVGAAATSAAVALILSPAVPLGIPAEWAWHRATDRPSPDRFLVPVAACLGYLGLALAGHLALRRFREWWAFLLLPLLLAGAAVLQHAWFELPVLGTERWPTALYHPGSSGYFLIARAHPDLGTFLAGYKEWIATQDNFHVGTHPPGLIASYRILLDHFESHPGHAEWCLRWVAPGFARGLAQLVAVLDRGQLSGPEQATLWCVALVTWLAGLLTSIPLYALMRMGAPPASAWIVAAAWPLVPAPLLFFPLADSLYPLLATSAVLLCLWSAQVRLALLAVIAGALWCAGMLMSLAFVVVAPIVLGTLLLARFREQPVSLVRGIVTVLAFVAGAGLLLEWLWYGHQLNMLEVWQSNLAKHAGFYLKVPRSYWAWVGVNLLEVGIVLGPAAAVLAVRGLWSDPPGITMAGAVHLSSLATLLALDLCGRTLGEAARLWILMTPFLCLGIGRYFVDPHARSRDVALLLACQGLMSLVLLAGVEPLLPAH